MVTATREAAKEHRRTYREHLARLDRQRRRLDRRRYRLLAIVNIVALAIAIGAALGLVLL